MTSQHMVFTEAGFRQLLAAKKKPLTKLSIDANTKKSILRLAKKKVGKGGADPLHRFVVCKATREGVVCWVVGADDARPKKKKKKPMITKPPRRPGKHKQSRKAN
jgi:hypothetical protein